MLLVLLTLTEGESLLLGVRDRSGLHRSTLVRSLQTNKYLLYGTGNLRQTYLTA